MHVFLPRQLVFFKGDKQLSYYRLRFQWDGRFSLKEQQSFIADRPFVLLLDTSIPFRRNFQFSIKQRVKKEFILASAAGLFPFALDEYSCSLGNKDSESYIFALKNSDYADIIAVIGQPSAVLVSDFNESAIISAVQAWMSNRSVYALNSLLFPVDPTKLLSGILMTFLLVSMALAWGSWASYFQKNAELVDSQANQITAVAEPLLHKRMVISHMQSVHMAFDKLAEASSERSLRRLISMMEKLPANCYIETIQFENGRLEVHGWGSIPVAWFAEQGIAEQNYQITDLPKTDRFMFWLALADS